MNQIIQYCDEPATISRLKDSRFIDVNEAFLETSGYRRDEVLGHSALELGLWAEVAAYEEIGLKLRAGSVKRLPVKFRIKSGEIRRCLLSAVLVKVNGEPCCISFVHDITETIEQSERLRATEQQLTHIVNHAPVVINQFDRNGIMTMRLGKPVPGEEFGVAALGKSMFQTFAESPEIVQSLADVLSGKTVNFTVQLRSQWFDVWAEPLRGTDGSIEGGMSVSAEVTNRVAAEHNLAAEREQFRTLVDNSTDIIVLMAADGRILFANPALQKCTGYTATEFIDSGGFALIKSADLDEVKRSLRAAFASTGRVINFRFEGRLKSGEVRHFQASGKVMPGRPDQVIIQARDITSQEVYEAELKRARDAAIASAQLQSAFVANISHEVRTPLNVILGYLDLLAEHLTEQGDITQNEYIETAARAGQRLAETISNVLDYSRVEAGLFHYVPREMQLAKVVASRVQQFRAVCSSKGVDLRFQDDSGDAIVVADEYCLAVVLRNVLDNAVKFTDVGRITVRQFRAGAEVCVEISDTGVGMEADFLARVFEPFVQEDAGYTRNFEGSGLGLALSKRILGVCHARISARSEKGSGSTFSIYFPVSVAGDGILATREPETEP